MAEGNRQEVAGGEKEADALLVATHRGSALIRVKGRGSFKVGPGLKQFGLSAIGSGCKQFILDMNECVGMDSTFMGVLAGLACRLKEEAGGRMVMMNLNAKTLALLETLGLDRIIETYAEGSVSEDLKKCLADVVDMSVLDGSTTDRKLTLETMLTAHEDLVKISPDNLPKFKNVMAYLSADLKQFEGV
jgi:anti-sigma B factor antagonist